MGPLLHSSGFDKYMYDLREVFWWEGLKKDIAEFVAKYPNYQQVKPNTKSRVVYFKKYKLLP